MPTAAPSTTPIAPVSTVSIMPVSAVPSVLVSIHPTAPILTGLGEFLFPYLLLHFFLVSLSFLDHGFSYHALCLMLGPLLTVHSQFEAGSSSVTVPDPVSEAVAFFTRFDKPEVNDLDPADFWGSRPPYIDFHGFKVPKDCASHLVAIYSSRGDFMQGFRLGRSAREHFLKMLGNAMNDIDHNFVDTVSTERILQWRAVIQELVSVRFAVEFILDHLREIA